jgi:hypothetical protein
MARQKIDGVATSRKTQSRILLTARIIAVIASILGFFKVCPVCPPKMYDPFV